MLFTLKTDGGLRLCVNYCELNVVTVKNCYSLPLIDEILSHLTGIHYFFKIDLHDAYHQIRIKKGDKWKTTFHTKFESFEYLIIPFKLLNASAIFQSSINRALVGLVDVCCVVYLDNILIFLNLEGDHKRHIKLVIKCLREYQLFAKLLKCHYAKQQLHVVSKCQSYVISILNCNTILIVTH